MRLLKGEARARETGRPSDERWRPSTSAGSRRFYPLITLQSSTGTLRVVNYFAKRGGDVPRRSVQRAPEWNKDAKLKSARAGKRRSRKGGKREGEDEEEGAGGPGDAARRTPSLWLAVRGHERRPTSAAGGGEASILQSRPNTRNLSLDCFFRFLLLSAAAEGKASNYSGIWGRMACESSVLSPNCPKVTSCLNS